jgi:hypothetical protein
VKRSLIIYSCIVAVVALGALAGYAIGTILDDMATVSEPMERVP